MSTPTSATLTALVTERAAILRDLDGASSAEIARLNAIEGQLDRYDWREVKQVVDALNVEQAATSAA